MIWRSGGGTGPAVLAWAVIALPLLPLWVPLGVLCAAPRTPGAACWSPSRIATAVPLAYCLATRPVTAEIRGHTLGYVLGLPRSGLLIAGYLLATVGALLLSGDRLLRGLGVPAAVGAAVCAALCRLGPSRPGAPSRRCAR